MRDLNTHVSLQLQTHAPGLKVEVYNGLSEMGREAASKAHAARLPKKKVLVHTE